MSIQAPSDGTKGPVPIKGSPTDDPNRPPIRRELRDMHLNHPKEWALFLLGLEKFKGTSEEKPLSYFQIAGIHGKPFNTWPNQDWNRDKIPRADPSGTDESQWQGFCTHSSILFLPWHRPYLALFEETELRRHVQAVAEEYTVEEGRDEYIKAARTFRLPYWDWALPAEGDIGIFPQEALLETKHEVVRPKSGGKATEMAENPLAQYKFGKLAKSYDKTNKVNTYPANGGTVRWPTPESATSDEVELQAQVTTIATGVTDRDFKPVENIKKGKNLTERVLYLLQAYEFFGPISSNYFFKDQKFANWGSLEDIHNVLHGVTGGSGHMGSPAIAAFDPIFWLHHANIDRLFAIWQALWDDGKTASKYVTPEASKQGRGRGGTFSIPWNRNDTIDTPLTPFTKSEDGVMWSSKGTRSTTAFGYVYPETQSWLFPTKEDIWIELRKIYKTGSLANTFQEVAKMRNAATETLKQRASTLLALDVAPVKTAELVEAASTKDTPGNAPQGLLEAVGQVELPSGRSLGDLVQDNKYLEWLVDIKAEKHSLGGNFVVHVFLGNPDDTNPLIYIADANHVSLFSTFGTGEDTGCGKCKEGQEARIQVTGQIPLTLALVERYLAGKIDSITPDHVIPYLQQHLHWRVTEASGVRSSRADVRGLLVSVVSNEVTVSPGNGSVLPRYAPSVTPWPAATTRANGEPRGQGTGYTGGQQIISATA